MHTLLLVGTAVGLSMDACAVAISRGLGAQHASWRRAAEMGAVFGLFQGVMPCLGFAVGIGARGLITAFDHWLAFILLAGIGGKMLWEARHASEPQTAGWPGLGALLVLGLATSIDALAAGFTLATLDVPLALAAGMIAGTTFVLATACAHFGRHLGARAGRAADVFGGVLLIAIGIWILVSHLTAEERPAHAGRSALRVDQRLARFAGLASPEPAIASDNAVAASAFKLAS